MKLTPLTLNECKTKHVEFWNYLVEYVEKNIQPNKFGHLIDHYHEDVEFVYRGIDELKGFVVEFIDRFHDMDDIVKLCFPCHYAMIHCLDDVEKDYGSVYPKQIATKGLVVSLIHTKRYCDFCPTVMRNNHCYNKGSLFQQLNRELKDKDRILDLMKQIRDIEFLEPQQTKGNHGTNK